MSHTPRPRPRPRLDRPLCRFFLLTQTCRNANQCAFSHELPDGGREEAMKYMPCPFFQRGNCRYGEHCKLSHEATATPTLSLTFQCGICMEDIVQSGKRFGLLSCPHIFCMGCIRSWRQSGSSNNNVLVLACPECRKKSSFVIPSSKFCVGEEKKQLLTTYKQKLAQIPCRNFHGTLASCPFGRDCFYAHIPQH